MNLSLKNDLDTTHLHKIKQNYNSHNVHQATNNLIIRRDETSEFKSYI